MLQKITDLWPRLLAGYHDDQEDEAQQPGHDADDQDDAQARHHLDEEQVQLEYKNLYWTRLITVEGFVPSPGILADDQRFRWPLGPDIVEECNAVADLPAVEPGEWAPLFDPQRFAEEHRPLELEQYRLPQEDIHEWHAKAVQL